MPKKKKHDHTVCEHEITYCKPCNEVYCEKCDHTWQRPCQRAHSSYTITGYDSIGSSHSGTGHVSEHTS